VFESGLKEDDTALISQNAQEMLRCAHRLVTLPLFRMDGESPDSIRLQKITVTNPLLNLQQQGFHRNLHQSRSGYPCRRYPDKERIQTGGIFCDGNVILKDDLCVLCEYSPLY
jgi:hypothetical protein